jgi:glutathione S-transferase
LKVTLYDYLDSGNGYKARLLLAQLGRHYRWVELDIMRGATRTPAFLAKNPNGRIPTLELEDGNCIAESNAILWYLADGSAFLPAGRFVQAQLLQWMFFEQYSHEPYIAVNRHWKLHLPPAEQSRLADRIALNHARGEHALAVMEQRLSNSAWLAAGRYTIADFALYAYTHTAARPCAPFRHSRVARSGACATRTIPQIQEEQGVPIAKWPG